MTRALTPTEIDQPKTERFDGGEYRDPIAALTIGQWYWISEIVRWDGEWTAEDIEESTGQTTKRKRKKGEKVEWLGCVMEVGSNFVELHSPPTGKHGSRRTVRVHFDSVSKVLRFEPNADQIIREKVAHFQSKVNRLLGQVQEVTQRLGVVPTTQIANQSANNANSLAVISEQVDTDAYKNALVLAKDTTLPELFEEIETANKNLASWMAAPSLPIQATIGPMKENIKAIEDRIYTISLYAGLAEEAVKCCDGDPAMMGEKLRVMQRRLYMDEECLLSYVGGGIEITDVGEFDRWISEPENRDRLLPFPRCLAAFRVRREDKDREDGGNIWRLFVNVQLKQADKKTFLYVRNGEQVWRIDADFEFDEMIFPNQADFDPSQPMMVKMFANRVDKMIPLSAYEHMVEQRRLHEQWKKEHPGESSYNSPYKSYSYDRLDEFEPFDPSSVYFDEATEFMQAEIKRYNRIAVIIQGLFDRSLVLHPHPPVRVWDPVGFAQAIELIYDATTLTYGEPPNFEEYRAILNSALGPDCIVTGQEDFWMRKEAEKENKRQENDWRNRERSRSNYTRYRPYNNPGPGLVSNLSDWKPRARKAVFRWDRESTDWRRDSETITATVEVPDTELLNVSAYTPGDYKFFFADPRTRREYLKWAPLMLAAEDYHAGKIKLGGSSDASTTWESRY